MARTGLTWKLKLDDAMSGAAQKIATKLGQVKGALNGLDEAKVTGPTAATTNAEQVAAKIADDRAARVQKAMQAESAASAKFAEQESARAYRAADQIATAQEKGQERVQAARDRIRAAEEKYAAGSSRMTAKQAERQKAAIVKAKSELQTEITKIERETQDKVDAIRTKAQRASADATSKFEARQQRSRERSQAVEARRSASETKKARKAIEAEERKIQRAAAKTKKAARPQQDDGEGFFAQLAGGFGQFVVVAQAAFDVAARVIGAIVSAVGPMIKKAMELQKFAQSTKYAFGQLLGSGNAADDAWNRAQEIAIKTGLSLQDVASSMNALLAQGMGIDEVTELTKRFADLRAINPAANIDGIARAMSQIKATGRLQGDELMQLNEAGLSSDKVYSQLEKRLGKTREEVLKLQQAGKISAEDALAAIKAALAEQTGKAAGAVAEEAASKTLGGAIGRLQAQIDKMLSSESPAFATLARAINMVVEMLAGGKFSGALSSLTGLFGSLAGLAERFVIAISKGGADDALGQMGAGLSRISKAIDGITVEDIIGGLKSLADSIRFVVELWQAFWTLGAPARDMASGVLAVVGAIGQLVIWIGRAVTELGSMIGSIEATTAKLTGGLTGAFTSSGTALGTSFVSGIVEAISSGASAMAEAARSAASSAVDAAMDAIGDIELPSFGGTVPGGGMMGDSMMMGAAAGRDMRSGDTNRTFSPTVNVNVSGGASNTGGMVSAIGDALKSLNNSFA